MLYLHDVWTNFVEEEFSVFVSEFHEWKTEDEITLLDQVPVIIVKPDTYTYMADGMNTLPKELMESVHQKAYLRVNHERVQLEYTFILTDTKRAIIIDTKGTNRPVRKSKLIPRQDAVCFEMVDREPVTEFEFPMVENQDSSRYYGLTRRDREVKRIFEEVMELVMEQGSIEKLRYMVFDLDSSVSYDHLKKKNKEQLYNILQNSLKEKWSERHEQLLMIAIKGYSFLEDKYENYQRTLNK